MSPGEQLMRNEKILIDTNILIYAWDQAETVKQQKAIDTLEHFRNQLYLSVQNLSEFTAVMMKHRCDPEWLHRTIRQFAGVMNILPLTQSEILNAIKAVNQYPMHYWDAQIWAVARSNGIDSIFTEDGPIGETIEGVTYINPLS
ncbi:PIN domain-containing protein [Sporolactobacillus sp. THM7-7]|nr:PIN domain-containing protein [Sporolactobacillus sp. THM7-7]